MASMAFNEIIYYDIVIYETVQLGYAGPGAGAPRGSPGRYRIGSPSSCMQSGAISMVRMCFGSIGAAEPPATSTGVSESSAWSAPCEAPPTWALPPGTSNSQPGLAVTQSS